MKLTGKVVWTDGECLQISSSVAGKPTMVFFTYQNPDNLRVGDMVEVEITRVEQ